MRVPVLSMLRAVRRRLGGRVRVRVGVVAQRRWASALRGARHRLVTLGRVRTVTLVTFVAGAGGLDIGVHTLGMDAPANRAGRPAPIDLLAGGPSSLAISGRELARTSVPGSNRKGSRRKAAAYYRRTASKHVPTSVRSGFLPLYREAERAFGVNWRLIASVHRQETAFSTVRGTYRGLNSFGCCGGPMQFNVTNGPVSTWDSYRNAFRAGKRPRQYPHRTKRHPSIYDDFDAIMAAGSLLSDGGASASLDGGSWRAAYGYYGHDLFGVTYANQVVARARAWQRDGFCLNCGLDEGVVAALDDAYGVAARLQLGDADERRRAEKKAKAAKKRAKARRKRAAQRRAADRRAALRRAERDRRANAGSPLKQSSPTPDRPRAGASSPSDRRDPSTPTATSPTSPPVPTTSTQTEPPAVTSPAAPSCPGLKQLLGRC